MTELEIPFRVRCPVCSRESPTGYRISVVVEALQTLQIRLYADCHVAGWDASDAERALSRRQSMRTDRPWSGIDGQTHNAAGCVSVETQAIGARRSELEFVLRHRHH